MSINHWSPIGQKRPWHIALQSNCSFRWMATRHTRYGSRAVRSPYIFLPSRLSLLPRLQVRPIAIERIVVHVEDTRFARALTTIIAARAHGRHGAWIVVVR